MPASPGRGVSAFLSTCWLIPSPTADPRPRTPKRQPQDENEEQPPRIGAGMTRQTRIPHLVVVVVVGGGGGRGRHRALKMDPAFVNVQPGEAVPGGGGGRETEGGQGNGQADILRQALNSRGDQGERSGRTDAQLFPDMLSAPNGTCKAIHSLRCSQGRKRTSSNQIMLSRPFPVLSSVGGSLLT